MDDLQKRLAGIEPDVEVDAAFVGSVLAPAAPVEIFARMLRNLRAIHAEKGEHLKGLAACNRIVSLMPDCAQEYRERGDLYVKLECFRAALADFRHYLKLNPQARDSARIARQAAELEPLAARLN